MQLKQITLLACLGSLLASNTQAGMIRVLQKIDYGMNCLASLTAGMGAYSITHPQAGIDPDGYFNWVRGPIASTMGIFASHKVLIAWNKQLAPQQFFTPLGHIAVGATCLAAGLAAYKLVKYLLTPTLQDNNNQ